MTNPLFKENTTEDKILIEKLSQYYQVKGKASFYFLCHAALPLFFRLDWLYYLWANFRQDIKTNTQQEVPYHAVADVLQTPFLATIGIELFEMEQGVRDFLLYELEQAFGKAHIEKLASFLQQYAQQCIPQGYEREAHLQSALIIQDAHQAAQHIGKALQHSIQNEQPQETNRLLYVLQSLLSPVETEHKKPLHNLEKLASLHQDIQQNPEEKPKNTQRYPKLSTQPSKNSLLLEVPTAYWDGIEVEGKPRKTIIIAHAIQTQSTSQQQQQQNNPFLSETKLFFRPKDFDNKDTITLPAQTEKLDLSGILIDETIQNIADLTQLTYLKLSDMELSSLTFLDAMQASGGTFEKLEVLDISNNQLTQFKAEYLDLILNLKELYFFGNVVGDLSENITKPDTNCLNRLKCHYKQDYIETVNSVDFKMISVKNGKKYVSKLSGMEGLTNHVARMMGGNPPHEEKIDIEKLEDFYIAETQVTQALWKAVMGNNPSYFAGKVEKPVEQVSWEDVQIFLQKLNTLVSNKNNKWLFRLPTKAEWQYSENGELKHEYAGSDNIEEVAWYKENSYNKGDKHRDYGTHAVKNKKPNLYGLYDMTGNVWEWCEDWYDENKTSRVLCGGSWRDKAEYCNTDSYAPAIRENFIGFRLVSAPLFEALEEK